MLSHQLGVRNDQNRIADGLPKQLRFKQHHSRLAASTIFTQFDVAAKGPMNKDFVHRILH
jgi:hypothetical protein